jgi:hypothetical protein
MNRLIFAQSERESGLQMTGMAGRSKSRLHCRQPAEKPPRQPRVVDQDNSLSFRNHEGYIANRSGFDNAGSAHKKRGRMRPPLFIADSSQLVLRFRAFRTDGALRL